MRFIKIQLSFYLEQRAASDEHVIAQLMEAVSDRI